MNSSGIGTRSYAIVNNVDVGQEIKRAALEERVAELEDRLDAEE